MEDYNLLTLKKVFELGYVVIGNWGVGRSANKKLLMITKSSLPIEHKN